MSQTRRQEIAAALRVRRATARELADAFGVPLHVVLEDLAHLTRSHGKALRVLSPACFACGYRPQERRRTSRPSRCPRCRSERICWPLISLDPAEPG